MPEVDDILRLIEPELEESFIRASGPGGQNVNKVSSAVELRFDVRGSRHLPTPLRLRLERLAGSRLTREGVLVIRAGRHRTQEQNRADARERLSKLIHEAAIPPRPRVKTRVPFGSKQQRLEGKTRRGAVKKLRRQRPEEG